jgi:uncharacterized membrane protein
MRMDRSTHIILIEVGLTFLGSCVVFILGIIVSYVRSINRNTMEMSTKITRIETKTEAHEKGIDEIWRHINNQKRGSMKSEAA